MSYEYKDEIIMNLKDYNAGRRVVVGGTNAFESKIEELHEVYSQVSEYEQHKVATSILVNTLESKVIEYEAKAKAFDYILGKKNEVEDDIYKFAVVREESAYQYLGYEVFKFIDEYESGEQDAKK